MPHLHNETDKAQNKRLKAELANERATVADLVEALERIEVGTYDLRPGHAGAVKNLTKSQIGAIARAAILKAEGR